MAVLDTTVAWLLNNNFWRTIFIGDCVVSKLNSSATTLALRGGGSSVAVLAMIALLGHTHNKDCRLSFLYYV